MLKNLLLLSGFSTFVVIVIIGLNIYHNYELSSLSSKTQIHVKAIVPSFDKKTLNDLKKRIPISITLQDKSSVISEDAKQTGGILQTPTPTIALPPTASRSASPIPINPARQP